MRKVVYSCKYINDWEKLDGILLPEKKRVLYSMKSKRYTDADCTHAKRDCKDFKIKAIQSDSLLLADIFINFWNMFLEIYELNPACFITELELAWQGVLKKTKAKLDLLTDV